VRITPAKRIQGRLRMPGDKSISHRAALIAALAKGKSRLRNFASGEDCAATLSCLRQLGITVHDDGQEVLIESSGDLVSPAETLDCGNSGSTLRMLAGVLAGQSFNATLTGDKSLRRRPMRRIIEPLELMGAHLDSQDGRPPLHIKSGRPLIPISYALPVASAQVKSCILFAALHTDGRTSVIERTSTRDHTERLLQWFDVPIEILTPPDYSANTIVIDGAARLTAREVTIPGDMSSAAFFVAAAAMLPESDLIIDNVGLNPTRTQFLTTLLSLGARIETDNHRDECNEPLGSVHVRGLPANTGFRGGRGQLVIDCAGVAALIDELPLLAIVGTQIPGGLEIRDAAELRLKETDRIASTAENLRAMGAEVKEFDDGLAVNGPVRLQGATIEPGGDHRIAMGFTVAALIAEGESEIKDAGCVGVSFPGFFDLLEAVTEH
jgi:3-phosphoshikimate 1-carboxyvinyltransferase